MRTWGTALILTLSTVACGEGGASATSNTSPDAAADGASPSAANPLRLNQLQALATHNSYHVATAGVTVPDWQYTRDPLDAQLDAGVRGVELDTHYNAGGFVEVFHVPSLDATTTCSTLADCLGTIAQWSDAHPEHHTLFVQIEPKDDEFAPDTDYATYVDVIDQEIASALGRERILTPDDVQGSAATLREAVVDGGWPTLAETRGRVLFFIDERGPFHDAYTAGGTSVTRRLMFPSAEADEPLAAVRILNTPGPDVRAAVETGFIVRTRADSVPVPDDYVARRELALASGAQIVTTDFPVAADGVPALVIPGGAPSRCNPVTAPPDCDVADLE